MTNHLKLLLLHTQFRQNKNYLVKIDMDRRFFLNISFQFLNKKPNKLNNEHSVINDERLLCSTLKLYFYYFTSEPHKATNVADPPHKKFYFSESVVCLCRAASFAIPLNKICFFFIFVTVVVAPCLRFIEKTRKTAKLIY